MDKHDEKTGARKGPQRIVNANRVTVALPFSRIALEESGQGLGDLASLVQDLTDAVASVLGNDEAAALRRRARELSDRLNS
jgi:hypothetical protein